MFFFFLGLECAFKKKYECNNWTFLICWTCSKITNFGVSYCIVCHLFKSSFDLRFVAWMDLLWKCVECSAICFSNLVVLYWLLTYCMWWVGFSVQPGLYLIEPTVRIDCTGNFGNNSNYLGGVKEGQEPNQGKSSFTF